MGSTTEKSFHHVHLNVNNLEHTTSLFKEVFHAKVINRFTVESKEIIQLELGGVNILLSLANENRAPGIDHIAISTDKLENISSSLIEREWNIIDKQVNNNKTNLFVKSPEGIIIELLEK